MGRVFACTDLHGRKDLFDKINAILEEDDKPVYEFVIANLFRGLAY